MTFENDFSLMDFQGELRKLMKVLASIFEANGLTYFGMFGTCLGAMRHKGMIPWDDDIDIAMLRPDYERALQILQEQCADLFVWNWDVDEKCNIQISRIFWRIRDGQSKAERLVFIDLFPIDNAPRSKIGCKVVAFTSIALRRLILRKCKTVLPYKKWTLSNVAMYVFALPLSAFGVRTLKRFYRWLVVQERETGMVWLPTDHANRIFPIEIFAASRKVPFDDMVLSVPVLAEGYLERGYDAWRVLPPEGERAGHAFDADGLSKMLSPSDALRS